MSTTLITKTIRFKPEEDRLLEMLKEYYGVRSQSDVVRMLVKEKARELGLFTS